jgi:hypothetical protein
MKIILKAVYLALEEREFKLAWKIMKHPFYYSKALKDIEKALNNSKFGNIMLELEK